MKYFLAIFLIFLINSKSTFANSIEYTDVKAKGIGSSYTEALNNSLSNAIAQVNGRSIETEIFVNEVWVLILYPMPLLK